MVGTSEPLTITLSKPFVIEKIPATNYHFINRNMKLLIAELIKP
jgi:hypothetical protein